MSWFRMPNESAAIAKRLGTAALAVYVALARRADATTREAWPGLQTIADDTGLSERSVERAVQTLKNAGFIEARRRFAKSTIYKVVTPPAVPATGDGIESAYSATGDGTFPPLVTVRSRHGCPGNKNLEQEPKNKRAGKPSASLVSQVQEVVDHYRTYHPRSARTLNDCKTAKAIKARLREGYTVADICQAIDGCHRSPFHCGENDRGAKYQSLELICRSSDKLTAFIELANDEPTEERDAFAKGPQRRPRRASS